MFKQMEEQEARNWLNISMSILRKGIDQASIRLQYYDESKQEEGGDHLRAKWDSLLSFLNIISRKMEEFHQKIVLHTFPIQGANYSHRH